jgi:hypothetical protein
VSNRLIIELAKVIVPALVEAFVALKLQTMQIPASERVVNGTRVR